MQHMWLIYIVCFLVGILANEFLHSLRKSYGVLRIDRSNPDKDKYRFEIENLDVLANKKIIVLKVDNNADLSQK